MVHGVVAAANRSAMVYFPLDSQGMVPGAGRDIEKIGPQLQELQEAKWGHSGEVHRIFFDETVDSLQELHGMPVADEGNVASYNRSYYGRYGRWGILHMLSVRVGIHPRHKKRYGGGSTTEATG